MREAPIPSYRVREATDDGGSRRMMLIAGGVAGILAVGGLVGWAVSKYTDDTIPVVEADSRPIKVRPDDRGGLRVANQDEIIFQRRNANGSFEPSGRLGPAAEAPNLDALRAATMPPPVVPPVVAPMAPAQPAATAQAPGQNSGQDGGQNGAPGSAAAPQPGTVAQAQPPAAPPAAASAPAPAAPQAQPAAPPAAAAPPAPVRSTGGVVVQLGALDSESGARSEWDRLARRAPEALQGRTPQVLRFERDGYPTMWRLRTGGFDSRDSASSFCDTIKSRGGACAVIGG
ncbi:SPOR domain-containing protein [Teichococcus aestuarii]|uniref:SPOR domain-containing protein n=1 Tax=Teichococcus aestuarii TaxID=568898 RepID=UPI0036075E6E